MSAVPAGTDGPVRVDRVGAVTVVTIDRPAARNAVDGPTAAALHDAFVAFDADAERWREDMGETDSRPELRPCQGFHQGEPPA